MVIKSITELLVRLGENNLLLVTFYQMIADRFKEADYGGTLIASILQVTYSK